MYDDHRLCNALQPRVEEDRASGQWPPSGKQRKFRCQAEAESAMKAVILQGGDSPLPPLL